jgi:hypothetical protein
MLFTDFELSTLRAQSYEQRLQSVFQSRDYHESLANSKEDPA